MSRSSGRPFKTGHEERIPLHAMLGFTVQPGDVGRRVLLAQLRFADTAAPLRLGLNILGLIFIWRVFDDSVPSRWLMGWTVAMLLAAAAGVRLAAGRRRTDYKDVNATDLRLLGWAGLIHGLLWLSAILIFPEAHNPGELMAFWTLLSCVMICGAITFCTAPLGAMAFLLPVAGGTLMLFDLPDQGPLRGLSLGYAGGLLVAALFCAGLFVRHHRTRVQLEEKSEVVSLLLREYEEGGSDWLWQTDAMRRISGVSRRFAETIGLTPEQLEGVPLVQILAGAGWESGQFAAGLHGLADHLKHRENFSNLVLPVEVHGQTRWWELSASPRHDEAGTFLGFRGVGSDITAQRESADKIAQLARFDTLTGLPNRSHLQEVLDQAMRETRGRKTGCAFLMIDLDRFKSINDTLGHQTGDRLLTQVAHRLRQTCSGRGFCGRIGGDEFAVVVQHAESHGIARLSGSIIGALSAPYQVDQHMLHVGASVGSALSPHDGAEPHALIRSADLALYRAKGEGGGIHCAYEPQLHADAEERRLLELALRDALEKDELHVLYQPVVNAEHGTIVGFEALARWTHPEMGPISPAKFVPVAEEARLIAPIGEWVLRTACMEAAKWPEAIRIAVNVSAEQLTHASFVGAVVSSLAHSGLAARRLELEVTESVFLKDDAGALQVLDQLLALGVQLSLDDFGTGYSSLGYLSRTRFNTIKIDRSFVVGASKNIAESLAIIRAVVTLADSLGMATTAEGVETEAELAMVRELGCRKVQGYYFGRPMLAVDAARLFPDMEQRAAG